MNAILELQRLKQRLIAAGYSYDEASSICNAAAAEISDRIADAVANALAEAEEAGLAIGALDFAAELQAVPVGDVFQIVTDSGRTDFSEPPFPMLSRLLKNAKVAKDGSRYTRIPIADKTSSVRSSYEVVRDRQIDLERAKQKINSDLGKGSSAYDVLASARSYAELFKQNRVPSREERRRARSGDVSFKTASSKQDPSRQWVLPPKEHDMTGTLMNINVNLRATIEEIVRQTIMKYGV